MGLYTGNEIEAMGCSSFGRPLRPLFHFLCAILFTHRVQTYPLKVTQLAITDGVTVSEEVVNCLSFDPKISHL